MLLQTITSFFRRKEICLLGSTFEMCWSWTLPIYLFDLNHGSHRENKVHYSSKNSKYKKRHFSFPLNKLLSMWQGKNVHNITAWTRLRCWMHSVGASLLCSPFCIKRHLNYVNSKDCSENRIINSVPAYIFVIDPFYPVSTPQWMPKKSAKFTQSSRLLLV